MDWRDLRFVLAVGQHESIRRAAGALEVDPTTVSRRIDQVEEDLGTTLFVRRRQRWRLTDAGHVVLRHAERMAGEVRSLRHDLDQLAGTVEGSVRLTAVDAVITTWLVPQLPKLRRRHPQLQLEFYATPENVDLHAGRADIALRLDRPRPLDLKVKKLADLPLAVAATPDIAALPFAQRPIVLVGFATSNFVENRIVRALGGGPAYTTTSLSVLIRMVKSGLGVGFVPRSLTDGLTVMRDFASQRSVWRAVPSALADAPSVRAVTHWLDEVFDPEAQDAARDRADKGG